VSANGDRHAALATIRVLSDAGEVLAEFENLELRSTTVLTPGKQSVQPPERLQDFNRHAKSRFHLINRAPLRERCRAGKMVDGERIRWASQPRLTSTTCPSTAS
jgi:hypothetical protein